jgi:hypothetical protein
VRVPDTMGAPWRISSVQTMYGWPVAVVMIRAYGSHGGKSILSRFPASSSLACRKTAAYNTALLFIVFLN